MSRTFKSKFKNFLALQRAPWAVRFGLLRSEAIRTLERGRDNDYNELWRNAGNTADVEAVRVGPQNNVRIARMGVKPTRCIKKFQVDPAAAGEDTVFFIADQTYKIHSIEEVHSVLGSHGSAVTLLIRRCTGTQAAASGSALCSSINMKATADTVQTATLASDTFQKDGTNLLTLTEGDRLSADFTGTLTALTNVVVSVELSPGLESNTADVYLPANGDLIDSAFYIATRPQKVTGIKQIHSTLGTNGSAVSLQVTKDTGTNAPGAGTNLLTNNSNAGFNLKSTVETVQEGSLASAAATLLMNAGDRLALDFAGTLTTVAGLLVSVKFEPTYDCLEVTWHNQLNADLTVDGTIFIADRNYRILRAYYVHDTADGASTNIQLETCTGTTAPGSGTALLSNNTSAGFDANATVNTVQAASWIDEDANYLRDGDRLAVDIPSVTSLAGVTIAVALEPI